MRHFPGRAYFFLFLVEIRTAFGLKQGKGVTNCLFSGQCERDWGLTAGSLLLYLVCVLCQSGKSNWILTPLVTVIFSSWYDIRNHVKIPPVLQVSSWSLGRHGHSWWTWRWCQMGGNSNQKCLWSFHNIRNHIKTLPVLQVSGTMSRLHLSSKSPPGF